MSASVIEYELLDRIAGETRFLWQYDYGQKMRLTGIDLPISYTVHFANSSRGASIPSIGDASGVSIPDQVLLSGKPVYFWLFLHVGESDGQTAYANTISVHPRANIPTIDPPSPEQQSILDELIAALNAGIEHVEDIKDEIPGIVDDEIAAAKERGEFKGDPGAVFTPTVQDGVMIWTNDGGLPNPAPTDFKQELGIANLATKQELNGKVDTGMIGSANGVAGLDASGRIPSEQLPSYVDDVLEFSAVNMFPNPGESGKIYISLSNNHQYRWTGTQYIDITSGDLETLKADKRDTVLETTLSRGRRADTSAGMGSIAFGNNVTASGSFSTAIGNDTIASGEYAYAEGYAGIASGDNSHAEGYSTHATGVRSHAEGRYTWAIGINSHAEGDYTQAEGDYAHGEGNNTHADGTASHSEGSYTHANGDASHAEGKSTITYTDGAHAEGSYTVASSDSSHAEGVGGTFTIGNSNYQSGSYGQAAHSEGYQTRSQGVGAHSEGENTVANSTGGHAEGIGTRATGYNASHSEGSYTLASDDNAHAEGSSTVADNDNAHAEGNNTHAGGVSSHAEGSNTEALATSSHSEGSYTHATGPMAHAEGTGSTASGDTSHAEGSGTLASGTNSHAEGASSVASGFISHAEGAGTQAKGDFSHTEGTSTQAKGSYSHAEGVATIASGTASHAEGANTVADGFGTHVEGINTIGNGSYSHVGGMYNVADSYDDTRWPEWVTGEHCVPGDKRKRTRIVDEQTVVTGYICKTENSDSDWDESHWIETSKMNYVEIIGNGTDSNARSNAYCLDWDGNGHFAGDVYVGCNPDGTGGVKVEAVEYMTLADAQAIIDGYGVSA